MDSFNCPITHVQMIDPVMCEDGNTYEREAIVRWIDENMINNIVRSPLTGANMGCTIITNRALRDAIQEYNRLHGEEVERQDEEIDQMDEQTDEQSDEQTEPPNEIEDEQTIDTYNNCINILNRININYLRNNDNNLHVYVRSNNYNNSNNSNNNIINE